MEASPDDSAVHQHELQTVVVQRFSRSSRGGGHFVQLPVNLCTERRVLQRKVPAQVVGWRELALGGVALHTQSFSRGLFSCAAFECPRNSVKSKLERAMWVNSL